MPDFLNLPGTYINRLDGGLTVPQTDTTPLILLLGTADKGTGDESYQAKDPALAREAFGGTSELYRGLIEARRAYGEGANIWLFRIGTSPATLRISGTNNEYIDVVPRNRVATIGDEYHASFNGVSNTLWIYDDNDTLCYSNFIGNPVDTGKVEIRGDITLLSGAQSFGDSASGLLLGSAPIGSGAQCSGTVFTPAVTGPVSTNKKAMYEALEDAYRLLEAFDCEIVVPLGVYADDYNVAYFISGVGGQEYPKAPVMSKDNPITYGSGVLTWFKETAPVALSGTGKWTYTWADDVTVSGVGNTAVAPHRWNNGAERIAAGYHEVSFTYQLANFCFQHTKNQSTCVGVIGFRPPKSYYTGDIFNWVGQAPEKDSNGNIVTDGYGLCGFMETQGATNTRLNPLCYDKNTGRGGGMYATASEFKDDLPLTDANGYPIDIGAYVSLVGDTPEHLNAVTGGIGYSNTATAYYAGLIARLDEKVAPTNQLCPGLRVPYKVGKRRTDDLCAAKIVSFIQRNDGCFCVDAPTAATNLSDYRRLSTVRIVSLVEKRVRTIGRKYIGQVANTLLREGLRSDIEETLQNLVKRGYLNTYRFDLFASKIEDILGKLNVKLVLVVPNELRQIFVTVSLAID